MQVSLKRKMRWSIVSCSLLIAALMLAACGGSSATPPTATATTAASAPTQDATPTPTTAAVTLKTYKGEGFTIGYPSDWTAKPTARGVTFADSTGSTAVVVTAVADPEGVVSADTSVTAGMKAFQAGSKNYKKVSLPATTTLAGETWQQQGATADSGTSPSLNVELVTIATIHPPQATNSKTFAIVYTTLSQSFDQTNTTTFQLMLQSFKFV